MTTQSQSPTQSYFAAGPSTKSTTNLTSPSIGIPAGATNLQLKFWQNRSLQSTKDAGKLEFSINNGPWFDVEAPGSGAIFASNGYNVTVKTPGKLSVQSEFNGLRAWSGNTTGFVETIVNLTDTSKYAGNNLRLRWRIATDADTASSGWYIDSISLLGGGDSTNQAPVITADATSSSVEIVTDPDSTIYQIVRGPSTNLSVTATDNGGEPSLIYTWAVTSGPPHPVFFPTNASNAAKTTSAEFEATGDYQISVAVRDAQGLTATSELNVRILQVASGVLVSPPAATLPVGSSQAFSASLLDQFGVPMVTQPSSFAWSKSGGGTINSTGVFTATTVGGPYVINAASGGLSNTASVSVTPAPASVVLGNLTQIYTGIPSPVTVTTDPLNRSTAVTYDNSPVVPTEVGSYAVEANITDPNYQGSASATLIIALGNNLASWRKSYFTSPEQAAGMSNENADPDSDNLPNLAEYALGTHPRQFTPPLVGTRDGNGFSLVFTRPAGLPDVTYQAESSENLGAWSPVPLEVLESGPIETLRARDPLTSGNPARRFLRLRFGRR